MFDLKKYIPFYALTVFTVACVTLPINQKEIIEIALPKVPTEVISPFQNVDEAQIEEVLQAMTLEEKIGQCILWEPNEKPVEEEAFQITGAGKIGGVLFREMEVGHFVELTDSLRRISQLPLFIATDEKVLLHGQFEGLPEFPEPVSISSVSSDEILAKIEKHYLDQCAALGINLSFQPQFSFDEQMAFLTLSEELKERDELANYQRVKKQIDQLTNRKVIAASTGFDQMIWPAFDSLATDPLHIYHLHTRTGLPGLMIGDDVFENDSLHRLGKNPLHRYFDNTLNFNGLSFAQVNEKENPAEKILAGADQIITSDVEKGHRVFSQLLNFGSLTEKSLDVRVRKVLKAKSWLNGGTLPVDVLPKTPKAQSVSVGPKKNLRLQKSSESELKISHEEKEEIRCYFEHPAWEYLAQELFEKSVILLDNHREFLPFNNLLDRSFTLFEFDGKSYPNFEKNLAKYIDFELVRHPKLILGGLPEVSLDSSSAQAVAIVLLDGPRLHPVTDRLFIEGLNRLSETTDVVLVNFGYPNNLGHFVDDIAKFQIFERNKFTESYVAQSLCGGVDVGGKLPMTVSDDLPISASDNIYKIRLSFGTPERNGISEERLVGINAIAESAIDNRVFPGCQVAVAKDGNVIFSRAFGQHTYGDGKEVKTDDLYDIASVTKVAATTLALMKLRNQNSIDITQKLYNYVPESEGKTVGYIRLKDLLIHRSNLQAPMPISEYFNYRNVPSSGCNDFFCRDSSAQYNVQISSELFFRKDLQQSIWDNVFNLKKLSRWRSYRYSDVNFFLLQKVVEEQTKQGLEDYVWDNFYRPLGLRYMTYNPLEKVDIQRIVPTERDLAWRKSLVHGFVHDPAAALMGGVGGNAGIFSNAEDMAVLFQMMLDDGVYGGRQFLEEGTVKEFATAKYGNHRGLGFDKPINRRYPTYSLKTPSTAYGHTGFTGTCVWVDPENDLVYVFLSNRVHPSQNNKKIFSENVRSRIHEVVYHAFESFDSELPDIGGE